MQSKTHELQNLYKTTRDVQFEMFKQQEERNYPVYEHGTWLAILGEEFGEVCEALQSKEEWSKSTDADDLYLELIQVASVAIRWANQIRGQGESLCGE